MERGSFLKKGFETSEKPLKETICVFVRHGDRTAAGNKPGYELSAYGRNANTAWAQMLKDRSEFDGITAVESIGSSVKSKEQQEASVLGRSAETAETFAQQIGNTNVQTTEIDILNYDTTTNEAPYNHTKLYNETFEAERARMKGLRPDLTDEHLNELAADAAQSAIAAHFNELINSGDKKAVDYAREWGGTCAYLLMHYLEDSNQATGATKKLATIGLHGPSFEWLLKFALVRTKDSKRIKGFKSLSEISSTPSKEGGGFMHTSESYIVRVQTLPGGKQKMIVGFSDPSKFESEIGSDLHLDMDEIRTLADEYKALHPELIEATKDELATGKYGAIETKLKKY